MDTSDTLFAPPNYFPGCNRFERLARAIELIGFGRSKVYKMIGDGRIKARKIDGSVFIDMHSVNSLFIEAPEIMPKQHAKMLGYADLGLDPPAPVPAPAPKPRFQITDEDMAMLNGVSLGADLLLMPDPDPAKPGQ